MNEKKLKIIRTAISLFAAKGYHATSIQEIAEQSGISKGGFYLQFRSKEELILSIFQYYHENVKRGLEKAKQDQSLTPRQVLAKQLEVLFSEIVSQNDFFVKNMQASISVNEEVTDFLQYMQRDFNSAFQQTLLSIYGKNMKPYVLDASIILEGMIGAYMRALLTTSIVLPFQQLSEFLVARLDNIVEGMKQDQTYLLHYEKLQKFEEKHRYWKEEARLLLNKINKQVMTLQLSASKKQELLETTEVLIAEMQLEAPRKVVFQAMLNNYEKYPELEFYCKQIKKLIENV